MTDASVLPFSAAIFLALARSESSSRIVVLMHQSIPFSHQYLYPIVLQRRRATFGGHCYFVTTVSSRSLLPFVELLQAPHADRIPAPGGDPFRRGFRATQ